MKRAFGDPKILSYAGAVLFAGGVAFAIVHLATGARYSGFERDSYGYGVDILLIVLWAASAATLVLRRAWMFPIAVWGTLLSLAYGIEFSIAYDWAGAPFIAAAAILAYLVHGAARAFPHTTTEKTRSERIAEAERGGRGLYIDLGEPRHA